MTKSKSNPESQYLVTTPTQVIDIRTLEDVSATTMPGGPRTTYRFDPEAPCPRWKQFLTDALGGSLDAVDFVQRAAGYSLTASTREQCMFHISGPPASGKSTILGTLASVAGGYSSMADLLHLFCKEDPDATMQALARLKGVRFVEAVSGSDSRVRGDVHALKSLTGPDLVKARVRYGRTFSFKLEAKIWVATNHSPKTFGAGDPAMWRRIHFLTLSDPDKADPELAKALKAERGGIFAWALQGAKTWFEQGLGAP